MRINRLAIDRLAQHKNGPHAAILYNVLVAAHGHVSGKVFAIVPDAMHRSGLICLARGSAYRAIETLIELGLICRVKIGRNKQPSLYRLINPALTPYPERGEDLSITLVSNMEHGPSAP